MNILSFNIQIAIKVIMNSARMAINNSFIQSILKFLLFTKNSVMVIIVHKAILLKYEIININHIFFI